MSTAMTNLLQNENKRRRMVDENSLNASSPQQGVSPRDVTSNIVSKSPYICFSMAKQSELWHIVEGEIDINEASRQIALAWEALSSEERLAWDIKAEQQKKAHLAKLQKKEDSNRFSGRFVVDEARRGLTLPFSQFENLNQLEVPSKAGNVQDMKFPDLKKKLNTLENVIGRNQPDLANLKAVAKPISTKGCADNSLSESTRNAVINCDTSTVETDRLNEPEDGTKDKPSLEESKNKSTVSSMCETVQDDDSFDDDEVQIIEPSEMAKKNPTQSKIGMDSESPSKSSSVKDKKPGLDSGGLSSSILMQSGVMQRKEQSGISGIHDPQVPFVNFSKRVTAMVAQNSPNYTREQVERIVEGIWQSMSPEERKLYDNPPIQDVYLSDNDHRILAEHNSVNRPNQLSFLDQIRSENRMMSNYFDQLPHESDASLYLREEQLRRQEALNHVAMLHNPAQHQSLQHQLMSDHFGLHVPRGFPSGVSDELILLEHDRRRQEELLYYRELNLDPAASRLYSDYDMLGRGPRR
mmetsp:Transcript_44148/g.86616  ORF Transcript_44148/g.86616 Transcript_44148/m.86616 type:complete len:524 (-) Transcript_44148:104-1675(-)